MEPNKLETMSPWKVEQIRQIVHEELSREVERLTAISDLQSVADKQRQLYELERTRDLRDLTQAIRELTKALKTPAVGA